MKIAIVNNLYSPFNRGGAEKIAQQQAEKLIQQGHQVFVISSRPLFASQKTPVLNYKIYYLYAGNFFSVYHLGRFPFLLRAIWRLIDIFNVYSYFKIKRIIANEKPQLVYAHNLTGLGYLLPRLFKKMQVNYVQVVHDVALIRPSGLLLYGHEKNNLLVKLYAKLTRYLFGSPNEVFFPSQWIKSYYTQYGFFPDSRKRVVKNFNLKTKNLLANKKLKQPGQINFLYLGQIEKAKGVLLLMHAFQSLPAQLQAKCKLMVVGSGQALSAAQRIASGNKQIVFYGHQPPAKVNVFLKQADYLIVPSLCYENAPTVIYEALNQHLPVIASALGGIPELVVDSQNGYLFKPDSPQALIKIIKKNFNKHFTNF